MHILGMAKSSLNLEGAKASKLELDFFKLAFAVAALRASDEQAIGYLQVLTKSIRARANRWVTKYSTGDAVMILCAPLSDTKRTALETEKARNARALLSPANAQRAEKALSLASFGEKHGESALLREITHRHPTVVRITDSQRFPQRINWDFYGIV